MDTSPQHSVKEMPPEGQSVENNTDTEAAKTYEFSSFNNKFDNVPKTQSYSWRALCDGLSKRRIADDDTEAAKDGVPISGAVYPASVWRKEGKNKDEVFDPDNKTAEDWRSPIRCNEFVEHVTLAILDFDNGTTFDQIKNFVSLLNNGDGAAAFLYSTWKHTPENPKLRLVIPLSSPVAGKDWQKFWLALAQCFDNAPDRQAKDASRMHFLPSCPQSRQAYVQSHEFVGPPLDVTTIYSPSKPSKTPVEVSQAVTDEVDVDDEATDEVDDPYAREVIESEIKLLRETKTSRNGALNEASHSLGRLVGAKRLKRTEAQRSLLRAANANGYVDKDGEGAALSTIKSGLDAGVRDPNRKGKPDPSRVSKKKKSQADYLFEIANEEASLFRNENEETLASVTTNGKTLTYGVKSMDFRGWLRRRYLERFGVIATSNSALEAVISTLSGMAMSNPNREAFTRVAFHENKIYYDLGDETGRVVEVDENGWRMIERSPVAFKRPKGFRPQLEPQRGGDIQLLRGVVNVKDEEFLLLVMWLISFFQPKGARPHLYILAEQGTAKTTTTNNLRSILDPNIALTRGEPKEIRDLYIGAKHNAILAFDNLSHIPQWLSDAMCCFSTGAAYATRMLYENDEEMIISLRRPVIFNSITDVATRPDLLDRLIFLELPLLREKARKQEGDIETHFQNVLPLILGALFDAISLGLKNLPHTRPENLPRMADFATWACACAPALGFSQKEVLETYNVNRKASHDIAAEVSSLAAQLESWATTHKNESVLFRGSPTGLLEQLELHADFHVGSKRPPEDWPKSAHALGRDLRRLAPVLRQRGLNIETKRSNGKRFLVITQNSANSSKVSGTQTTENVTVEVANGTPPEEESHVNTSESAVSDVSSPSNPLFIEEKKSKELEGTPVNGIVAGNDGTAVTSMTVPLEEESMNSYQDTSKSKKDNRGMNIKACFFNR